MTLTLYPDQQELLDSLRAVMRRSKSVLLQAATGSGKTMLSASMIAGSRAKGTRCAMVVPRRELLKQTALTFQNNGIPFSYIAAGYGTNPHCNTFLAIAPTLTKRLETAPALDVLIVDEVHFGGDGMDKIIQHYKAKGTYIIGLSASPARTDGRGLGCWFDDMVCGKPVRWLIDNKRLSDYRLFAPNTPDLSGIKTTAGDYNKGQLIDFMMQDSILIGDAVKYYKQCAMGKLCVTFTTSRLHSMKVADEFRNKGIPAHHIDGTMDDIERSRIIKSFARRELLQLVNCDLLTMGFDLASSAEMDVTVEAMTDLRPTKSLPLQSQKWGRVLRMKEEPAIILDHAGNCKSFGLPCEERAWKLEGTKTRSTIGKERVMAVRQCPSCFYCAKPFIVCPSCGDTYPIQAREIEHIDGELAEVTSVVKKPINRHAQYQALIMVAKKKNMYAPESWAKKVVTGNMRKAGEDPEVFLRQL